MPEELKPCPFCGSKGKIIKGKIKSYIFYYACCSNYNCETKPFTHQKYTKQEAIKAWNIRYGKDTDKPCPVCEMMLRPDHDMNYCFRCGRRLDDAPSTKDGT